MQNMQKERRKWQLGISSLQDNALAFYQSVTGEGWKDAELPEGPWDRGPQLWFHFLHHFISHPSVLREGWKVISFRGESVPISGASACPPVYSALSMLRSRNQSPEVLNDFLQVTHESRDGKGLKHTPSYHLAPYQHPRFLLCFSHGRAAQAVVVTPGDGPCLDHAVLSSAQPREVLVTGAASLMLLPSMKPLEKLSGASPAAPTGISFKCLFSSCF